MKLGPSLHPVLVSNADITVYYEPLIVFVALETPLTEIPATATYHVAIYAFCLLLFLTGKAIFGSISPEKYLHTSFLCA